MDLALVPKLAVAALVGAAVSGLPRAAAPAGLVSLKLEWIEASDRKKSESLVLRTSLGETTTVHQGHRTVEATPEHSPDGDGLLCVKLKVTDDAKAEPEDLTTQVHALPGETNVVMGTVKKDGRATQERLFFVTATPI